MVFIIGAVDKICVKIVYCFITIRRYVICVT